MSENDTSVFVVLINDEDNKAIDLVTSKVKGNQALLENVRKFTNESQIKKVIKTIHEPNQSFLCSIKMASNTPCVIFKCAVFDSDFISAK